MLVATAMMSLSKSRGPLDQIDVPIGDWVEGAGIHRNFHDSSKPPFAGDSTMVTVVSPYCRVKSSHHSVVQDVLLEDERYSHTMQPPGLRSWSSAMLLKAFSRSPVS